MKASNSLWKNDDGGEEGHVNTGHVELAEEVVARHVLLEGLGGPELVSLQSQIFQQDVVQFFMGHLFDFREAVDVILCELVPLLLGHAAELLEGLLVVDIDVVDSILDFPRGWTQQPLCHVVPGVYVPPSCLFRGLTFLCEDERITEIKSQENLFEM